MKKVVILGSTGKMGSALMSLLSPLYSVTGFNSKTLDVTDLSALWHSIEAIQPDVVINTVGSVGIEKSEIEYQKAFLLNSVVPYTLARLCAMLECTLIHFSTNAVFSGKKREPYVESDIPDPINLYGISKRAGEEAILSNCSNYFIIRTSTLVGHSTSNEQLCDRILKKIQSDTARIHLTNDLFGSPSYSMDVAQKVVSLMNTVNYGVHHVANEGCASIYDYISFIVTELQLESHLLPVSHNYFGEVVQQPQYLNISTEKSEPLRNWRDALKEYARTIRIEENT